MKHFLLGLFILTLQITKLSAQTDKEEAKEFFKSVVQSYFSNGDRLLTSFNDSIAIITPYADTLLPISFINPTKDTALFHTRLHNWTQKVKTYEDYLTRYQIFVYDKQEFTTKTRDNIESDSSLSKNMDVSLALPILSVFNKHYTDNDYLVVGNTPKLDTDDYLSGLFWMVVRKTPKGWKIFGTAN